MKPLTCDAHTTRERKISPTHLSCHNTRSHNMIRHYCCMEDEIKSFLLIHYILYVHRRVGWRHEIKWYSQFHKKKRPELSHLTCAKEREIFERWGPLTLSSSYHLPSSSHANYKNALNDISKFTYVAICLCKQASERAAEASLMHLNRCRMSSNIEMFFTFSLHLRSIVIDGRLSLIKLICAIHSSVRRNCVNRYGCQLPVYLFRFQFSFFQWPCSCRSFFESEQWLFLN